MSEFYHLICTRKMMTRQFVDFIFFFVSFHFLSDFFLLRLFYSFFFHLFFLHRCLWLSFFLQYYFFNLYIFDSISASLFLRTFLIIYLSLLLLGFHSFLHTVGVSISVSYAFFCCVFLWLIPFRLSFILFRLSPLFYRSLCFLSYVSFALCLTFSILFFFFLSFTSFISFFYFR